MQKISSQEYGLPSPTPKPPSPDLGCLSLDIHEPSPLKWLGWWQSANPEVAFPMWLCTGCGSRNPDTSQTRVLATGEYLRHRR